MPASCTTLPQRVTSDLAQKSWFDEAMALDGVASAGQAITPADARAVPGRADRL